MTPLSSLIYSARSHFILNEDAEAGAVLSVAMVDHSPYSFHLPHPLEFWPLWGAICDKGSKGTVLSSSTQPAQVVWTLGGCWPCSAPFPWQCLGINANLGPFPTVLLEVATLFSGLKAFSPIGASCTGASQPLSGPWPFCRYSLQLSSDFAPVFPIFTLYIQSFQAQTHLSKQTWSLSPPLCILICSQLLDVSSLIPFPHSVLPVQHLLLSSISCHLNTLSFKSSVNSWCFSIFAISLLLLSSVDSGGSTLIIALFIGKR